jgi:hypothetical protein
MTNTEAERLLLGVTKEESARNRAALVNWLNRLTEEALLAYDENRLNSYGGSLGEPRISRNISWMERKKP